MIETLRILLSAFAAFVFMSAIEANDLVARDELKHYLNIGLSIAFGLFLYAILGV